MLRLAYSFEKILLTLNKFQLLEMRHVLEISLF